MLGCAKLATIKPKTPVREQEIFMADYSLL